jgi:hypothetical protein
MRYYNALYKTGFELLLSRSHCQRKNVGTPSYSHSFQGNHSMDTLLYVVALEGHLEITIFTEYATF